MPFQHSTIMRWPAQVMHPLHREPHSHLDRIGRNRGCPKQSLTTGHSPNPSLRPIFEVPLCQSLNSTRRGISLAIRGYPSPAVSDMLPHPAAHPPYMPAVQARGHTLAHAHAHAHTHPIPSHPIPSHPVRLSVRLCKSFADTSQLTAVVVRSGVS